MSLGPVQFDAPAWLLLLPIALTLTVLWARKSLTGMGGAARRVALAVRVLVLTGLIGALAEPHWRLVSEDVATVIVVDRSRSIPAGVRDWLNDYVAGALGGSRKSDRLGAVTTAADALTQSLPSSVRADTEAVKAKLEGGSAMIGLDSATDLAAGVRLAMTMIPPDAGGRLTLVSDGNETQGSLLSAARAAAAAGIPIDVLSIAYKYENEIIFEGLYAPPTAREGQTINLRMSITAMREADAEITLMMGDRTVDLSPDDPDTSTAVYHLSAGVNALMIPVVVDRAGARIFKAYVRAIGPGDTITENNSAAAVTFATGRGRVLVLTQDESASAPLVAAMSSAQVTAEVRHVVQAPRSLVELQDFDAVVLMNTPAHAFDLVQQRELAAYVRDAGGGLVMIGGPDSFGAGSWIGSPVADVLPVLLDPPQKRQLPVGALALVLDRSGSMAMPVGSSGMTQQRVANEAAVLAVNALSRFDYVTVIAFTDGYDIVVPLTICTDPASINSRIRSIGAGGGTNMFPAIEAAERELLKAKVSMRHMIVLTDGQTMGDTNAGLLLAQRLQQEGITLSAISIGDGANDPLLQQLAVIGGGQYYQVAGSTGMATLPQIFIKEAQVIKRSLIWEGDAFNPKVVNGAAEPMHGIGGTLPPMDGYVVTADREGLALTTARTINDDPLVAQWQHGLGRAVAYTSDATTRWNESWPGWTQYKQFWEQHIRWVMRPAGAANVGVATETRGDTTHVVVTALNAAGDPMNFGVFRGVALDPDLGSTPIALTQTAPGRYEGDFNTSRPGTHLITMQYDAPGATPDAPDRGTVQAAVLRPYPDEFRALQDNTALLLQVAELTGGRVLPDDPAQADLFSRQGLTMPVSLRPVWLVVALASLGLFLVDVAVRRVRIDIHAILKWARGRLRKKRSTASQVDALRAARQSTREHLAERARRAGSERLAEAVNAEADRGRKFEADAEYLRKPTKIVTEQSATPASIVDHRARHAEPPEGGGSGTGGQDGAAGGMSRLLAAKRRAQDQMKDEDRKN